MAFCLSLLLFSSTEAAPAPTTVTADLGALAAAKLLVLKGKIDIYRFES